MLRARHAVSGHVGPAYPRDPHAEVSTMRQRPRGRLTLPFVKASPEAQLRLLELADLDTELGRLDHRRRTLPETAELAQLAERAAKVRDAITIADTNLADLDRDLARAEKDVEQVRVRIEKDNQRLDAGQVSNARELESLQNEVDLAPQAPGRPGRGRARADGAPRAAQALRDGAARRGGDRRRRRGSGDLAPRRRRGRDRGAGGQGHRGPRRDRPRRARRPARPLRQDPRQSSGGVGAAALRRGQCGGCREMLSTVELNEVRAAAPDEVVRHEECRRILVRTRRLRPVAKVKIGGSSAAGWRAVVRCLQSAHPAAARRQEVAERTRLIHNRDVNARFRHGVQ